MMNNLICRLFLIIAFLSGTAYAHPPTPNVYDSGNLWEIAGFYDELSSHTATATQEICFSPYSVVGTQIRGKWYPTTFSGWEGPGGPRPFRQFP